MSVGYETKALRALYEMSRATMNASTIEDIFGNILGTAMKMMGVTKASIMRFDPSDGTLRIVASRGISEKIAKDVRLKVSQGISGKVFRSGKPLLVTDVAKQKETLKQKRYKSRSLISAPATCFPLKIEGRPVGVVNMTDKKGGGVFTPADLELLTTIAAQAAAYIHIYDLIADLKKSERVEHEVEVARQIQLSLLPGQMPSLKGVAVAGRALMASRIGGDYFDVFSSGWSPPAFVVADVSGHDIGAALLMSGFRSALRSEVGIPVLPPSAVVRRMNRILFKDLVNAEQFISMFYVQYIHSSRTLRYSSAGHPPVCLYDPRRHSFKELATEGPLLGIERGEHFFEKKERVETGMVLLMYTDGLIETTSPAGVQFGIKRLKKSIAAHADKSPKAVVDGVARDIQKFAGAKSFKDDVTMLVLKFK